VLPEDHTPVRLTTESDNVTLFVLRAECNAQELLALEVDLLVVIRDLSICFLRYHAYDGHFCTGIESLTDCEELFARRNRDESDCFRA